MTHTSTAQWLWNELNRHHTLVQPTTGPAPRWDRRARTRLESLDDPIELDLRTPDRTIQRALLADVSQDGAKIIVDRVAAIGAVVCITVDIAGVQTSVIGDVIHTGGDDDGHYFGMRFIHEPVRITVEPVAAPQRLGGERADLVSAQTP